LIGSAAVVLVAVTAVALLLTQRLLATAHAGDYDLMRNVLKDTLEEAENRAVANAEMVLTIPAVRQAFLARDRAKLTEECRALFELEHEKYGLDEAQFHVPPGVSFLRLHDVGRFGDDLTATRPMIADVHQSHVVRKGVTVTAAGPGVYGVVPVLDEKGAFAGSFEFGFDIDGEIETIKQSYGLDVVVFIDEKLLREIATKIEGDVMSPSNRVGRYIRTFSTNPKLAAALLGDRDVDVTETRHFERTVNDIPWGVQVTPLMDFSGKQIGVIAVVANFGEDVTNVHRNTVWQLLAAAVGLVLIAGLVLVVVRGVLLAPLDALNERMRALADGDASKPADPAESYCDELRELAANYERLRGGKS
jgi:methyl-accepting chemotaxis protein